MSNVRQPTLADLPGVYRVCFDTAPEADPTMNRDLLGHVYAGPYVVHHPEFARVVADEHGISGYVLSAPDTRAFEEWAEAHWWPALREQYPLEGASPADAEMIESLHRPPRSPDDLVVEYPAHLHIDLLPRTQGHGYGRTLIEWLCAELAERGIPGVHLGVGPDNANAIRFYEHLGFTTLATEADVIWMGRLLRA